MDADSRAPRAALVVGGTSGIGRAVAHSLSGRGWRVAISGSRPAELGEAIAQEMPGARYIRADLGSPSAAHDVVGTAADVLGRLDTVVYTAGATQRIPHGDIDAVTDDVWERILGMNVIAPWRLVQAAAPHLRQSPAGSITLTGALAGVDVGGSSIPYAVSKAAMHHMVKLLGAVLGPEIRINAVAPGLIETSWTSGDGWEDLIAAWRERAPLRRTGRPEDVADLITGLIGAEYTTGQTVVVDGGFSLVP
ncbi:3-oxoacyl-[acyl-carrier protein] reductase [Actinomycetales bacterium JB111]|nr:3-oxoacyl-[acyl-carrier protein] reductase [Actinomycetales bacterium JB111]